MKTRLSIIAGLVVAMSAIAVVSNAQSSATIKVLPTTKEGIVKLLVVGAPEETVQVKFYSIDGLVETDAVKATGNGFNKKYDVRRIMARDFSMEVTSGGSTVTYTLTKSGSKLTPFLVKESYTYPLVASK